MRLPVLTTVLVAAALVGGAHTASAQSAYSYPVCAVYPGSYGGGPMSCYYANYAQCWATMSGIGGRCVASPYYRPELAAQRVYPRRHRSTAN